MKASIEVKDRQEAERIRTALADDATRAFVNVMGVLLPLSERGRQRVMNYVNDFYSERKDGTT